MSHSNPDVVYRPPTGGAESAHAHKVRRVTRKQAYVERTAEDGTVVGSEQKAEKALILHRDEFDEHESAYHGALRTRFYLSEEAAEAADT